MKTIIFFLLLIGITVEKSAAQWFPIGNSGFSTLKIQFENSEKGWLCTFGSPTVTGGIWKTTDAGNTWSLSLAQQQTTINYTIEQFEINGQIGFAHSSYYGIKYRTTNGGASWDNMVSPNISLVKIFSPTLAFGFSGYVDSTSLSLYKSTDTLKTWQVVSTIPFSSRIGDVKLTYLNKDTLYAFGGEPSFATGYVSGTAEIVRSTNGGLSWTQVLYDTAATNYSVFYLTAVAFPTPQIGYAFSGSVPNNSYKTTDGGLTWQRTPPNAAITNIAVSDAYFKTANEGYICGNGIWRTLDGGVTWTNVSGSSGSLSSMSWPDTMNGWAAGYDGLFFKTTNGGGIVVLPVELSYFTATPSAAGMRLDWATASEKNNAGFEVERSMVNDQLSMTNQWEKIGFVKGNGTTTEQHSYSFTDRTASRKVQYRLKQTDFDGKFEYSPVVEASVSLPAQFSLAQNYPNPFNPSTIIRYQLSMKSEVSLKVFDMLGREVATLISGAQAAGSYEARFDGSRLASGVYFYRLVASGLSGSQSGSSGSQTGSFSETKRMNLVK